jgi:hypothetical protein
VSLILYDNGRAIGHHLGCSAHDDGGGKLYADDSVGAKLLGLGKHAVERLFAALGHQLDILGHLATLPMLDLGLSALIEDLHARGLDKDVSVVMWGEFGSTPKINANANAGGGMRTGQVIGSTTRHGHEPNDRPIHYRDIFATLYHNMGINARHATVTDLRGRPHYLLDNREPIAELV